MALCGSDLPSRCGGIEHAQHRETEAGRIHVAELHVAAMAVGRVRRPALQDVLGAVGLADVVPPVAGVGYEVDPDDRRESGEPGGVSVLADDGLQLG